MLKHQTMHKTAHIVVSVTKDQLVHVAEVCNMLVMRCPCIEFIVHTIVDARIEELACIEKLLDRLFLDDMIQFRAYSLQQLYDSINFPAFIYEKLCTSYHRCLYARLFLDKLGLDYSVDHVLSLDTDILVVSPFVNQLFNVNLDGNWAAGALDIYNIANNKVELRNAKCLNVQSYVNCGVVVFSVKEMKKNHFSDRLLQFMRNAPLRFYYQNVGDQTFFNYAFRSKCKILDSRFNLQLSAFLDYSNASFGNFGYKDGYALFKNGIIYQNSDRYYWWDPQYTKYLESMRGTERYFICKMIYGIYLKNRAQFVQKAKNLGATYALDIIQHMKA